MYTYFMRFGLLILTSLITFSIKAEIIPAEGSRLNYRIVGFSFPPAENANDYKLDIAIGHITNTDSFSRKIVITNHSRDNKTIVEVPTFGTEYTWQVTITTRHSKVSVGPLYHFSTGTIPFVDTTLMRLRVINTTPGMNNDRYVLLDASMVMYDMMGNPVWYFPGNESTKVDPGNHRDLKITPMGTITFITATKAFEINYDGTIKWTAPNDGKVSGGTGESYHHEFTRLSNGHYMIMGTKNEPVYIKKSNGDSSLFIGEPTKSGAEYIPCRPMTFGTIIEYDEHGKLVWSYNTARYFSGSDIIFHRYPDGGVDLKQHDNSFYFDEKNRQLYISFKDYSRVIKVKYPEGNTLNTFGKIFTPGSPMPADKDGKYVPGARQEGNGMFCCQHCCRCTAKGLLYLFNNNYCHPGSVPSIVVMRQPENTHEKLEKVWEFDCPLEEQDKKNIASFNFGSGGNVEELPDGSFFASMTNGYGKVFIVNQAKELLWSAMAEKWNSYLKKWEMNPSYRASIITNRETLEQLIWGNQKK